MGFGLGIALQVALCVILWLGYALERRIDQPSDSPAGRVEMLADRRPERPMGQTPSAVIDRPEAA